MSDVLGIAKSGLTSIQMALSTTGHNIANMANPAYSRQTVSLSSLTPQRYGSDYVGTGVTVNSIGRIADKFVNQQLLGSTSNYNNLSTYYTQASRVDGLLSSSTSNLATGFQDFFSGLQKVVATPDNPNAREAFYSQAQLLVNRFHTLDQQFRGQIIQVNEEIGNTMDMISSLGVGIARINQQVTGNGALPPDVIDQRDQLLTQLSQLVSVSTVEQSDGTVNVTIGQGQSLVVGGTAMTLSTISSSTDPTKIDIVLKTNNTNVVVTNNMSGGTYGGLTDVRDQLLQPALSELGQIGIALADTFNQQHQLGMDLNGNIGRNFFQDINNASDAIQRIMPSANNAGNAVLRVDITDVSQLSSDNYRCDVSTGPKYVFTNLTNHSVTTYSSLPIAFNGMTISSVSGSANVGDSFLVTPTQNGASNLSLNISNSAQIATASPVRVANASGNHGAGVISFGGVSDTTNPTFTTSPGALSPPIQIKFLSPSTYQVINATNSTVMEGPITYNPNQSNALFPTPGGYDPGYTASISGVIQTGDTFNISYNSSGFGDNSNALALANLQNSGVMNNGSVSYQGGYATLVSNVGILTHEADVNQLAGEALMNQAQSQRDSISGVNLDEEATNLMKFQQIYAALGKVMAVANNMFDTIFNSLGR